LLLTPDADRLFDRGYISFHEKGECMTPACVRPPRKPHVDDSLNTPAAAAGNYLHPTRLALQQIRTAPEQVVQIQGASSRPLEFEATP